MKRICLVCVLIGIVLLGFALGVEGQEKIRIGIMQIIDHPALNAVRQGFIDAMKEVYGYVEGENIVYDVQSAQGDIATANTIARKFVTEKVDLILSIATPTSQAAVNATKDIPIVFSAVTDPLSAGLVKSLERPGGNVTGISDMTPVARQIALIKFLFPEAKRIGTLYNAGEVNSVVTNELAKKACSELGLELVEATVASTADVAIAAQSLVGKVDAIYVSTDNTVVSALDAVGSVCLANKIPLVLADPTTVGKGALCALGFDYYLHGRQTADIVARILKGEKPGDIPVEFAKKLSLLVNPKTVEALGLSQTDLNAKFHEFVEVMKKEGVEVTLGTLE
ncbi:MAG: ABC transporter substrate-binding protein [Candidatus Caldatribacterium sp.]|uniref:ABC transporter substrate-binding protein n=1 Tax=Candidatus Caldatribacterium sp. TaxID=2282143 RepID=UPI00299C81D6|nr:ABC transporter substrate-binding protein [Candidatus Caldatribacterium sp.]MCX7729639.1 ABC transporter substrate-binding protein [Candidatus Caldatribacterium sp.]MDW8081988.1 ABC transporter substrate-binding protein [Candidatus Calescibacterium sp.]